MNQLVGERLSIITSKAQTTRHRILGVISGEDFQIVYSDTPGILKPEYELHKSMMRFVNTSLEDADVILLVTDLFDTFEEGSFAKLNRSSAPIIFILNKVDLARGTQIQDKISYWKEKISATTYLPVSALKGENVDQLLALVVEQLPEHPAYFPKDTLTDKPERFFVSEIIREKIFLYYKKEVPYSCEVQVEAFQEDEDIIRMRAIIFVERKSQKGIIIGKGGMALKKVGMEARQDMELFFGKQVYLETHVKIDPDWRSKALKLKRFGYNN